MTGTLKYVSTGTIANDWGAGNFLAFDLSDNDFSGLTSVKVGVEPSRGTGLVEIINDPDKNGIAKISDNQTQKFVIVLTDGTNTRTQKYDLSLLNTLRS